MEISSVFSNSFSLFNVKTQNSSKSADFMASNEKNPAYDLNISDEAKNAYKTSQNDFFSRAQGSGINALAMPQELKDGIQDMQDKLNRILLSHNIDTSKPIEFTIENGQVKVMSNHPQKAEIERVLSENQDFVSSSQKTLDGAKAHATDIVNQKVKIAMENKDDDEEETESEKELRLEAQKVSVGKQIADVGGNFSLNGGSVSMPSIAVASSAIF